VRAQCARTAVSESARGIGQTPCSVGSGRGVPTVDVEPTSEAIARSAGEAMAALPGATVLDAIVMASAALRGDVVFTSDVEDLERLRQHFPTVRVLRA